MTPLQAVYLVARIIDSLRPRYQDEVDPRSYSDEYVEAMKAYVYR